MNPTAIFSKSGKGVQEASGKTSSLSRGDRAVLSAIDGRATLADVAGKVGKQFDGEFRSLINKLDKDGFIREVSPGAAGPAPKGAPASAGAKPAPSKPTAPMDVASDLDFTAAMAAVPKKSGPAAPPPQTVARAPAPPPKPTVAVPPKPPPPSAAEQVKQAQIAKDQQSAFAKAREEAERKQQEDRDRLKSEAEAKVRAETESKLRAEAEEKAKADAEANAKKAEAEAAAARSAAIRAAAEAKVKAEAEAKRAREEAERAKREAEAEAKRAKEEAERARQEAERAKREAEEKARREQEELKRKLEEERRAREEAERKAREEAERARRELEEERRKMEEERKQREEESRREDEERAARRKREDEEEQQRRALKEEQEETERTARRKQREEEEERERAEKEAKRKSEPSLEDLMAAQTAAPAAPPPPPPAPKKAATGDAFADSLLADLDSFTQRDDEDRKAKEEADRKAKEEAARRRQEESERQEREAAEARQREEDAHRRKEEEAQRARDEEERRARKAKEEQEQAERETEERRRKIAAASGAAAAPTDDIGITDDDLEMDEVKKEAALLEKKKNRKEEREKEREKERTQKKEREREAKSKKEKEKEEKEAKKSAAYAPRRRKSNLGRNLVLGVLLLAVIGVGVVHVLPVSTGEYESAATEAVGRPVKIGAGRFSLIGGVQYKFDNVSVGGFVIPTVRAFPELGSLFGDKKVFSRLEFDGMTLQQDALGEVLFGKARSDRFHVERVVAKNLKLAGALPLPVLEADVQLEGGGMRTATLRGGEGLVAKLSAKESSIDFDVGTSQFTLPFAPEITLVQFAMKGEATRQGMKVSAWDGLMFSGHMTGNASVRWGNTWTIEGVLTARGVNAAVFAPALVSNGRGEGTGRFSMSGVEPAKLGSSGRLEGNFMVTKGVLGSFDLSRALQTGGRQVTGQTQFAEMSGQGVYDRGAISLRNINLSAGALNAGASADISESGALSGRIIADVKTSAQNLRATLVMGGTVKEPQVK